MPQNIKSLIIVLLLSLPVFYIAELALANIISTSTMRQRRNTWLLAACLPFVTPNIWIYFAAISAIVIYQARKEDSPLPLFALLLLACIPLKAEIPGFAGIRYLFDLSYYRVLILALLVPEYIRQLQSKTRKTQPIQATDILILSYPLLLMFIYFPLNSLTNNVRYIFLIALDVVIPYFVITRAALPAKRLIEILVMFALGVCALAPVSIVEIGLKWPIFNIVLTEWDRADLLMSFLMREGMFRAQTTAGHSLVLGYAAMVAIGAWTATAVTQPKRIPYYLIFALLVACLIASLARGPWVGCAITVSVYLLLENDPIKKIAKFLMLVGPIAAGIMFTPFGTTIVNLLPFIGNAEQGNVEYRKTLFNFAFDIIKEYPLFGHPYFLSFMEGARNGEGLIDLVNIYLNVALQSGLVGLCLFTGSFLVIAWRLYGIARSRTSESAEIGLAKTLLACLAGILFTISTLSNIAAVPYIYWLVLATGSALVHSISGKAPSKIDTLNLRGTQARSELGAAA